MEQPERWEVNRIFTISETWEGFLSHWDENRTQAGAIGLLYEGTKVPMGATTLEQRAAGIWQRLDFYLKWARQEEWAAKPNPVIAVTAQQIIVKHWGKALKKHVVDECFSDSHQRLLEFLPKRWPSLLAPPYPRFIAEYLGEVCHVWQHGNPPPSVRLTIQDFTHLVVPALCVWGLGYLLAGDHPRPDASGYIERWLREQSYDPSAALQYILGYHDKPFADLRNVDEIDEEVSIRAALALLKLRHLDGRDVLTGLPTAPF